MFKLISRNSDMSFFKVSMPGVGEDLIMSLEEIYQESNIAAFKESGYKFFEIYSKEILMDNGDAISTLPVEELNLKEEDFEIQLSMRDCMIDPEGFRKYVEVKRGSFNKVEFPDPIVEADIKSKEDFIDYVRKYGRMMELTDNVDPRPFNSYIRREYMLTLRDFITDKSLTTEVMRIIEKKRKLSLSSYNKLITFLQTHANLDPNSSTPHDIVEAYNYWGPEGIACNVDAVSTTTIGSIDSFGNLETIGLAHDGMLHVNGLDPIPLSELEMEDPSIGVVVYNKTDLFKASLSGDTMSLSCGKVKSNLVTKYRVYEEIDNLNGTKDILSAVVIDGLYRYSVLKNDNDLTQSHSSIQSLSVVSDVTESNYFLDSVMDQKEFYLFNACLSTAIRLQNDRVAKPPFASTSEMLRKENVPLCVTAEYILRELSLASKEDRGLINAFKVYVDGPPQAYVDSLLEDSSYESYEELLYSVWEAYEQKMDDPVVVQTIKSLELSHPGLKSFSKGSKIVSEILNGDITVGKQLMGRMADSQQSKRSIADLLRVLVGIQCNGNMGLFTDILRGVESNPLFDISKVVSYKTSEKKGALDDLGLFYARKYGGGIRLIYVIETYRSVSSKVKRDEVVKCISLPILQKTRMRTYFNNISNQVRELMPTRYDGSRTVYYHNIGLEVAGRIMSAMYFKHNADGITIDGTKAIIKLPDLEEIVIEIPEGFKLECDRLNGLKDYYDAGCVAWITNYELYSSSWSCAKNTMNTFCVNAQVTPWRVIPHVNSRPIVSKPLFFSFTKADMASAVDTKRYRLAESKGMLRGELYDFLDSKLNLLGEPDLNMEVLTEDTKDKYLAPNLVETGQMMYQRILLYAKRKYLTHLTNKSDNVYANLAEYYGENILQVSYSDDVNEAAINGDLDVVTEGIHQDRIGQSIDSIESLVRPFELDDPKTLDLVDMLDGTFQPTIKVEVVAGNVLIIGRGGVKREVYSNDLIDRLLSQGEAYTYSMDEVIVKSYLGYVILKRPNM